MKKIFALIVFLTISLLAFEVFYVPLTDSESGPKAVFSSFIKCNLDSLIPHYFRKTSIFLNSVLLNKSIDKATGKNASTSLTGTKTVPDYFDDVVVSLSDGYLSLIMEEYDINQNITAVINLSEKLKEQGINFIYFELPHKMETHDPAFASYKGVYKDYTEEYEKQIRTELEKAGVDVVSFMDSYPEVNDRRLSFFFKTDHHWLPQSGLQASKVLALSLNEKYGYQIDTSVFDLKNYNVSEDILMLGSLGQKVSHIYCEPEILPVLVPLYKSDITVEIPTKDYIQRGPIEQSFFDYGVLESKTFYDTTKYNLYAYGNKPLIKVHNNLVNNGKRLLVLKTSIANVMTPFLTNDIEYLDIIDLREYKELSAYIEETKPDTVVMIYGTSEFSSNMAFIYR